ncbi:N-acetyltransferase NAT13 [Fistulina hepatica ATCC 64428]|uniref:N-acetyltransferase NAT13 n=1 Tax=Fistulina hepatica ATCC 64428 TaxID=1128425 RepID=A0A0D7A0W6_9AGAR|nr:N-acetyltransferase NAT13 [Fistulina hepatica ATCC 64428]
MAAEPRVSFSSVTPNNLGTIRKLNSVLFPIKYSEKFYDTILTPELEDYNKLVYYNDIPVGVIACRLEKAETGHQNLYLMTLGVLAPYRSRGLGAKALEEVVSAVQSSAAKHKIDKIYLHVQLSNGDAKRFYEKHGFKEVGIQEDYYKRIQPHGAWVLEKEVIRG